MIARSYDLTRSFIRYVLSIAALCALSIPAHAIENDVADKWLSNIYQIQINGYYSINGFYNYAANLGDKGQSETITDSLEVMGELLGELSTEGAKDSLGEQYDEVSKLVKAYDKLMKRNVDIVEDTGYSDLRLAGELAENSIALTVALTNLYTHTKNTSGYAPSKVVEDARQSSLILALMMTKYSARTTSTTSMVYLGADKERTLDILAGDFDKLLKSISSTTQTDENAADLIESAETKWDFIKNSYVNYNESRVNFIVNLYSRRIIGDIEEATASES